MGAIGPALPLEVLMLILLEHYLEPGRRLYSLTQLCHLLRALPLVSRFFVRLVHDFLVPSIRLLSGTILARLPGDLVLGRFAGLLGLTLSGTDKPRATAPLSGAVLTGLTNLTFLRLFGDQYYVREYHLTGLTRLCELRIEYNKSLGEHALEALGPISTLRKLTLWQSRVRLLSTNAQRAWRPLLQSLAVCRTTDALSLRDFVALQELVAYDCHLTGLEHLTQLRQLHLSACTTAANLGQILPRLQSLELLQLYESAQPVTEALLCGLNPERVRALHLDASADPSEWAGIFSHLSALHTLSLRHCGGTADGLNCGPLLRSLRHLRLEGACGAIDDATLAQLSQLTALALDESESQRLSITDASFSHLTNLHHLWLPANRNITDDALHPLTQLRSLHLQSNARITDRALSRLTNLTELTLDYNTRITEQALSVLPLLRALRCAHASRVSPQYRREQQRRGVLVHDETCVEWGQMTPLDYEWAGDMI